MEKWKKEEPDLPELKRGDWVRPVRDLQENKHGTTLSADTAYLVVEEGSLFAAIDKATPPEGPQTGKSAAVRALRLIAELAGVPDHRVVTLVVDQDTGSALQIAKRNLLVKVDAP